MPAQTTPVAVDLKTARFNPYSGKPVAEKRIVNVCHVKHLRSGDKDFVVALRLNKPKEERLLEEDCDSVTTIEADNSSDYAPTDASEHLVEELIFGPTPIFDQDTQVSTPDSLPTLKDIPVPNQETLDQGQWAWNPTFTAPPVTPTPPIDLLPLETYRKESKSITTTNGIIVNTPVFFPDDRQNENLWWEGQYPFGGSGDGVLQFERDFVNLFQNDHTEYRRQVVHCFQSLGFLERQYKWFEQERLRSRHRVDSIREDLASKHEYPNLVIDNADSSLISFAWVERTIRHLEKLIAALREVITRDCIITNAPWNYSPDAPTRLWKEVAEIIAKRGGSEFALPLLYSVNYS